MPSLLLHTLRSIGKRPVQTVIIILSLVIVVACFLIMFSMPDIFFASASLWAASKRGDSQHIVSGYANDFDGVYDEMLDSVRSAADGAVTLTVQSELTAVTPVGNALCHAMYVDSLDPFLEIMGVTVSDTLDDTEELRRACVPEYFLEMTGLSLGDEFVVDGTGPVRIVTVVKNDAAFYPNPMPIIAIEINNATMPAYGSVWAYFEKPQDNDAMIALMGKLNTLNMSGIYSTECASYVIDTATASTEKNMPMVYVATALIIGLMSVLLVLSDSVIVRSRTGELVRFKAAGATPAECVLILIGETVLYSVIGGLLGLGAGKLVVDILAGSITIGDTALFAVQPAQYALSFFLGLALGVLVGIVAAIPFARKPVRRLIADKDKTLRKPPIILPALACLATAGFGAGLYFADGVAIYPVLVLFLVSSCLLLALMMPFIMRAICYAYGKMRGTAPGYIAARSAVYSPAVSRTATALALLIAFVYTGTMLINCVTVLSSSSNARYESDYLAFPVDGDPAFATELIDGVMELDGVTEAWASNSCYSDLFPDAKDYNLWGTFLVAVLSPEDLKHFCRGIDDEVVEKFATTEYGLVVNYYIAQNAGLEVGDTLELRCGNILFGEPFVGTIVGIDYTSSSHDSVIYVSTYMAASYRIHINTDGTEDLAELTAYFEDRTDSKIYLYRSEYYNYDSSKFSVQNLLDTFLMIVYIVAALGIINLIAISAGERKREGEIYRLIGFAPSDTVRFYLTEACILTAIGGISGFLSSLSVTTAVEPLSRFLGKYLVPYIPLAEAGWVTLVACGIAFSGWMVFNLANLIRSRRSTSRERVQD